MKKMKLIEFIAILAVMALAAVTLIACGGGDRDPCESGHSYGSWSTTTAATCTTAGSQTRTCLRCSETQQQSISINPSAHNYGSWTTTTAATCTTDGIETRTCSLCFGTDQRNINATDHSYDSWSTTTAATCTTAGSQTRTCSRCSGTDQRNISATGQHSWGAWSDSARGCTATRTCSVCSGTEQGATHTYGQATCPECGIKYNYVRGDIGPGEGTIFHVVPAGFVVEGYTGASGSFASYTAHFLEVGRGGGGRLGLILNGELTVH